MKREPTLFVLMAKTAFLRKIPIGTSFSTWRLFRPKGVNEKREPTLFSAFYSKVLRWFVVGNWHALFTKARCHTFPTMHQYHNIFRQYIYLHNHLQLAFRTKKMAAGKSFPHLGRGAHTVCISLSIRSERGVLG